jgi:membrane protease YdiL (CAAX protease family)
MRHEKTINKAMLCLILAAVVPSFASAQEGGYITGSRVCDIFLADIGGFGGGFAAVGLNFLMLGILGLDGDLSVGDHALGSAVTELSDIPLLLSGSPDGVGLSLGGAALWGAGSLANLGYGIDSRCADLLYWGKTDLTMYRAYDSYASLRLRSAAWDNSGFRRHGFLELMAAPFDYRIYGKPQPWIALAAGLGSSALMALAFSANPWEHAVWTTGSWYVGESPTNPAAFMLDNLAYSAVSSVHTGAGEEAVFRGFLHEELKTHFGEAWATVLDTSAFLTMHFFTDLVRGLDWGYIAAHMAVVAGAGLLNDWAYDVGGLPLAAACHALSDFAAFCFNFLTYGGVPRSAIAQ